MPNPPPGKYVAPGKSLRKLLCAEDDPDLRLILEAALGLGDLEDVMCESGIELLGNLDSCAPDLLLLDVMMPGLDGPATLTELRKRVPPNETPVIFVTARRQASEVRDYLGLGALAVIPKPFDLATLAQRIKDIWREHGGMTQESR
mgnify:CR=1 FL=1